MKCGRASGACEAPGALVIYLYAHVGNRELRSHNWLRHAKPDIIATSPARRNRDRLAPYCHWICARKRGRGGVSWHAFADEQRPMDDLQFHPVRDLIERDRGAD